MEPEPLQQTTDSTIGMFYKDQFVFLTAFRNEQLSSQDDLFFNEGFRKGSQGVVGFFV